MTPLVVEAELPLRRVTFPRQLDHSWAFSTSAIHARPMALAADSSVRGDAAQITQLDECTFELVTDPHARWTDGRPLVVGELAQALRRGLRLFQATTTRIVEESDKAVVLTSGLELERLMRRLAMAAFSLTPCIRQVSARHTCGPFAIAGISDGGRDVELVHRGGSSASGVDRVRLVATHSTEDGLARFDAGEITMTRVLGGRPRPDSEHLNVQVDLLMGLRGCPGTHSTVQRLARLLDRTGLAARTAHSYIALAADSTAVRDWRDDLPRTIGYADFYPNQEVAGEISAQLSSVGVPVHCTPISYEEYLRGEVPSHSVQLDIVDPHYGTGDAFEPLLQAQSTLNATAAVLSPGPIVNAYAELDWSAIQIEGY